MNDDFYIVGIIGYPRHLTVFSTHKRLYTWLRSKGYKVIFENKIAKKLRLRGTYSTATIEEIGKHAGLAIIVGGDGNMLGAARILVNYDIKVIGINRGNLGFLTDLHPENFHKELEEIFKGNFFLEKRSLLEISISCNKKKIFKKLGKALNEIVIHPDKIAHMIDFKVYIDKYFAFSQRADGLIISTPTGSTAYALSAGGPIISPNLDVILLMLMFPHSLSSRPLIISGDSTIEIEFSHCQEKLQLTCDGQISCLINKKVLIRRFHKHLNLIHPRKYMYFKTLNKKLNWSKRLV